MGGTLFIETSSYGEVKEVFGKIKNELDRIRADGLRLLQKKEF